MNKPDELDLIIPDETALIPFASLSIFQKRRQRDHKHANWRLRVEVFHHRDLLANIIASRDKTALLEASRILILRVERGVERQTLIQMSMELSKQLLRLGTFKRRKTSHFRKSRKKETREEISRELREAHRPKLNAEIKNLTNSGLSRRDLRSKIIDTCIRFGLTRQQAVGIANKHTKGDAPNLWPISKPIREERDQIAGVKEYTRAQIDQLLGNWTRPTTQGKGRSQQSKFRDAVLHAYGNTCSVTGGTEIKTLEAAHIKAYSGPLSDDVNNGICLRADIHKLFDADLIRFSSDFTVSVDPRVSDARYQKYHGQKLRLPVRRLDWPKFL